MRLGVYWREYGNLKAKKSLKTIDIRNKRFKINFAARCSTKTIINVASEKFGFRVGVLFENELLNKTNKQISVFRSHLSTYSYTIKLFKITIVKRKTIENENKFC